MTASPLHVVSDVLSCVQAPAKNAPKQKIAKPMKVNAPRVGGKR